MFNSPSDWAFYTLVMTARMRRENQPVDQVMHREIEESGSAWRRWLVITGVLAASAFAIWALS